MSERTLRLLMPLLVLALCAALVVQAFEGRDRRQAICANQNATLDVLHDLIVLSSTPPAGTTFTAKQVREITAFQSKAFARIDEARC